MEVGHWTLFGADWQILPVLSDSFHGEISTMLLVAGRIAEAKGSRDVAFQETGATPVSAPKAASGDSDAIARIRAKMTEAEQIIAGLR